ncbi:hypothetical protein [Paenibacillus polymyxa]|uniref:hypothetical protein n=1 Tax=Paenibacillus polymyxa TaxID=1406 RepID=UPI000F4EEBE6|nr:hypothetical protein [Paenibacillus polymyxa]RPE10540.1 hypothetical protein EG487_02380 [Paenibacillus polymyxa]
MTQQMAEKIIRNYATSARALRENTAALTASLSSGLPEPEQLNRIWAERDAAYMQWSNAAASLRELPSEYSARLLCEIEQLPAI